MSYLYFQCKDDVNLCRCCYVNTIRCLVYTEAAVLRLDGTNVSEVYLTGYLVPEFDDEYDEPELTENYFDDLEEIDDEEEQELEDDE